jgi:hypothetical protein
VQFDIEPEPAGEAGAGTTSAGRPARRRRIARLLLAAGAAGVLAIGAFVVQSQAADDDGLEPRPPEATDPGDPAVSLDGWTPEPAALAAADVAALEEACTRGTGRTTVLGERRGDLQLLLRAGPRNVAGCLATDDGVVGQVESVPGGTAATLGDADILVLGSVGTAVGPSGERETASITYGLVRGDVDAVTFSRPDGLDVEATVADGWWAVWWPGDFAVEGSTLTLDGGQAAAVPVDAAWWRP